MKMIYNKENIGIWMMWMALAIVVILSLVTLGVVITQVYGEEITYTQPLEESWNPMALEDDNTLTYTIFDLGNKKMNRDIHKALDEWEYYLNGHIKFQEIPRDPFNGTSDADITFFNEKHYTDPFDGTDVGMHTEFFYYGFTLEYPEAEDRLAWVEVTISDKFYKQLSEIGRYNSIKHEIGHALGLGHVMGGGKDIKTTDEKILDKILMSGEVYHGYYDVKFQKCMLEGIVSKNLYKPELESVKCKLSY